MLISFCFITISFWIFVSLHMYYCEYGKVHCVLFSCFLYVTLSCVFISAELIEITQARLCEIGRTIIIAWQQQSIINRALLANRILIKFWKFLWKAVSRNGGSCKQPKITLNITCIIQLQSSMLFYDERQHLLILLLYCWLNQDCTIFRH